MSRAAAAAAAGGAGGAGHLGEPAGLKLHSHPDELTLQPGCKQTEEKVNKERK
jgi:hypothetical protein